MKIIKNSRPISRCWSRTFIAEVTIDKHPPQKTLFGAQPVSRSWSTECNISLGRGGQCQSIWCWYEIEFRNLSRRRLGLDYHLNLDD
jgi:hypothetical protein